MFLSCILKKPDVEDDYMGEEENQSPFSPVGLSPVIVVDDEYTGEEENQSSFSPVGLSPVIVLDDEYIGRGGESIIILTCDCSHL